MTAKQQVAATIREQKRQQAEYAKNDKLYRDHEFGLWESGNFTKLPFESPEGLYSLDTPNGRYSVSLAKRQFQFEYDNDFEPKTPDWCPLNKEPITITKE